MDRRCFLVGCSSAIAAMAGSRLNYAAFGTPGEEREVLIYVFLRGGMDGLSLVPPIDGPDRGFYEAARPELKIAASGENAAFNLNGEFGLHASAAPLLPLFQDGRLAIIQAAGMDAGTRSHFEAQEFIELGTPGKRTIANGWLSRVLLTDPSLADEVMIPSVSMGALQPTSLRGNRETLALDESGRFSLDIGPYHWRDAQRLALRTLYRGRESAVHAAGDQALNAVDIVEAFVTEDYQPANGAEYPNAAFGGQLKGLAQLIKLDLGLRVATIDLGGWDTHENQGNRPGQYFGRLIEELSQGLAALYTDLDGGGAQNFNRRLTVVVQSEFGRRLRENADEGTDHGTGNLMLVLGGEVNGGFYGQWPGLDFDQLFDNADLAVTTDFRRVLSEILIRRMGNPRLSEVFPGYQGYTPLGIVQGEDLTVV
ncbi:MAG: DUF1501 domain-containing protein [Acidobacteriota bacterium]